MLGRTHQSLLALALAITLGGCDTADTTTSPALVDPTKLDIKLSLSNPNACGCASVVAVQDDPKRLFVLPIGVNLSTSGTTPFVLRPPGFCDVSGLGACGHLIATVSRLDAADMIVENIEAPSSTSIIEVPLGGPGDVNIAVTLFDDAGMPLADVPPVRVSASTSCAECPPSGG